MCCAGKGWDLWYVASDTSKWKGSTEDEKYAREAFELVRANDFLSWYKADAFARVMSVLPTQRKQELETIRAELRQFHRFERKRVSRQEDLSSPWSPGQSTTGAPSLSKHAKKGRQDSAVPLTRKSHLRNKQRGKFWADNAYQASRISHKNSSWAQAAYVAVMKVPPGQREAKFEELVKQLGQLSDGQQILLDKLRAGRLLSPSLQLAAKRQGGQSRPASPGKSSESHKTKGQSGKMDMDRHGSAT